MQAMRLNSVGANRHIFGDQVNGKPLRLLLRFDGGRALRLAGDGEGMIADDGPLDEPFEMGESGQVDVADVTETLFPTLRGVEVSGVEALILKGRRVGARLNVIGAEPFHVWVDGDELYWGDEATLVIHEWLDGIAPTASERIEV
jgi:hypothetical protein